jgi:hypothetical protein
LTAPLGSLGSLYFPSEVCFDLLDDPLEIFCNIRWAQSSKIALAIFQTFLSLQKSNSDERLHKFEKI